jgi:DNA-binding LacI/PurR family transcriptional regulator
LSTGTDPARATLETVARSAGVSRQTVSNVLNAPHLVRQETLERVREAIEQVGYRPHRVARTLRTRRSHLIAAPMQAPTRGVGGAVLDAFLHALTTRAQQRGYRVMLFTASDDAQEIAIYDELLTDHDLDAFVLTGTHIDDERTAWLTQRNAAFVTFGRPWGAEAHHGWVDVDGAAGLYAATGHLIECGHRRIAFLGWPPGSGVGDDRRQGWRQACREAGLAADLDRHMLDSLPAGRAASAELLDLADPPTAFACVSDSLALGVWTELTARGLTPGQDVAITGFDDSPTAAVIGLSSVAQPADEVALACLALLHQILESGEPADGLPEPVLLAPTLVLRDTTLRRRT